MATGSGQKNKVLDAILGSGHASNMPATVYVGLYSSAPTDSGGGSELSGSGYARVAVTNNSTNWPAASSGQKSNGTDVQFPLSTGVWATATHWGIFDAATLGNLLHWGALTTPVAVPNNAEPVFDAGLIVLSVVT